MEEIISISLKLVTEKSAWGTLKKSIMVCLNLKVTKVVEIVYSCTLFFCVQGRPEEQDTLGLFYIKSSREKW